MDIGEGSGHERNERRSPAIGQPRPKLQKSPVVAVGLRKSAKHDADTLPVHARRRSRGR